MVLGVDFADGVDNRALFVDDVGGTQRAIRHLAVHLLLTPRLIGFEDGEVDVSDEVERQVVFGDETLVRGGTVAADTQHLIAQGKETLVVVAQIARLGGAARRAVFRIEIEHQLLAFEVGQTNSGAVLVKALKMGCWGSYG